MCVYFFVGSRAAAGRWRLSLAGHVLLLSGDVYLYRLYVYNVALQHNVFIFHTYHTFYRVWHNNVRNFVFTLDEYCWVTDNAQLSGRVT